MNGHELWLAAGLRTPFARVDGPLAPLDAVALSVPVMRAMTGGQPAVKPDLLVWGTVIPNLGYSNIAREVQIEAGLDQTLPAFSTVLACSTSMVAAFEAAGMLGHGGKELELVGGGKSMGEHCEEMAQTWKIARDSQDKIALASHEKAIAGQKSGFFDDLIVPVEGMSRDGFPRADTSLERLAKLQPAFDRKSGKGTITAGNASPLTDGAAGLWVATGAGIKRLPGSVPRARLVDWEIAAVNVFTEGLLMAPAYAIPRMLARNDLAYGDIALWEIHEAFAAQVLCNVAALESASFRREKAGVEANLGKFPWERLNPHGGSVALGHPFGATGARILSQAVKELAAMPKGSRAVVSICADGGLGTVALLEN